eukprot:1278397-Prymnesium_polylepis.1
MQCMCFRGAVGRPLPRLWGLARRGSSIRACEHSATKAPSILLLSFSVAGLKSEVTSDSAFESASFPASSCFGTGRMNFCRNGK